MHPTNRNELIVWDLAHDPAELATLTLDEARQRLFTRAAELPEGVTRLPIKTIHANKSPVVFGNLKALGPAAAALAASTSTRRCAMPSVPLRWAGCSTGCGARCSSAPTSGRPRDVDEDLYGGFVGNADRALLQRLRATVAARHWPNAARPSTIARLDELFFRYRARNFPDTLDDAERARWRRALRRSAARARCDALTPGWSASTSWPRPPTSAGRPCSSRWSTTPSPWPPEGRRATRRRQPRRCAYRACARRRS